MKTFLETYLGFDLSEQIDWQPEGGPAIYSGGEHSIPLEAPPRHKVPRNGRHRRSYDRQVHNFRQQIQPKTIDEVLGNTIARTVGILSDAARKKKQVRFPGVLAAAAQKKHQAQVAANEDISGTDNSKPQKVDPFKRALGVVAKAKKKRTAQTQEDISAEPLNRTGKDIAGYDKPLGASKKKRKYKLADVLDTENMSESGPPAFIIQIMQGPGSSQWRDYEIIPASYQVLAQRLAQIKAELPPGFRARGIDAKTHALLDITS